MNEPSDRQDSVGMDRASRATRRARAAWLTCALALVLFFAAFFAWFVWPTTYRYDHMNVRGNIYPVRIERWSGRTEIMYPSGWKVVGHAGVASPETSKPNVADVPPDELARLESRGEGFASSIFVHVYNGSVYHVTQITVQLVVWEKASSRELVRRLYAIDSTYSGPSVNPRSSSQFQFDPHFAIGNEHGWSFQVVSAKGYQSE